MSASESMDTVTASNFEKMILSLIDLRRFSGEQAAHDTQDYERQLASPSWRRHCWWSGKNTLHLSLVNPCINDHCSAVGHDRLQL